MWFYDTHAHLDFPDYKEDLEAVLERARAAGVSKIITIGTDAESSRRAIRLAEVYQEVFAVVGWHPGQALEAPADFRSELRELAAHPKVAAIGETGLDYYRLPSKQGAGGEGADEEVKARQASLFRQHLEVAAELRLNCVIHQREAFADTMKEMGPVSKAVQGVFHCFVDGPGSMEEVVAIGSCVSFTGISTFKTAGLVRETLGRVPSDRYMLETDSPFLAPVPYRGKRCEPAYVREVAALAAKARNCSLERVSEETCANARRFFRNLG